MKLDNMYALLASHTNMNYHLVRGAGGYGSPVKVKVEEVLSQIPCSIDVKCAT